MLKEKKIMTKTAIDTKTETPGASKAKNGKSDL